MIPVVAFAPRAAAFAAIRLPASPAACVRYLRGRRAGLKACNHTLRPREEAIAERHEADWDESFEIGSDDFENDFVRYCFFR